ncbi:DUF5947 family protein [Streptomyces sp. NPDC005840]|uniref:DUF5947 family protein n=1 Tax=Streptomyces sp. NPDC005840 TaxID=3157072 RepID=UPI0033FE80AF
MTAPARRAGSPAATLLRLSRNRPAPVTGERCEMCAVPVGAEHQHVVALENRSLLCSCRACWLLFTDDGARLRYRAVPERYLTFDGPPLDARAWDELEIPVGLAFLFRNSAQERVVAFYPGPAGATESELPLAAWTALLTARPELATVRPDVEALLVRRTADGGGAGAASCHLVPIDACYELVGRLRAVWRGFDGGQEAHAAMDAFFARIDARARPADARPATAPTAAEDVS